MGQTETRPAMGTSYGLATESSLDAKSVGRKALPEDLFALNYSYAPPPVSGWYSGSPYGAGVPMQYNAPMVPWVISLFWILSLLFKWQTPHIFFVVGLVDCVLPQEFPESKHRSEN